MIQSVRRSRGVWLVLGICAVPLALAQEASTPPPAESGRVSLVDEIRRQDELFWQRAMAKNNELSEGARAAVAANAYQEALRLADAALQTVEAARKYADPVAKYERARAAAVELQYEVNDSYDDYQREQAAIERAEVIDRMSQRIAEQEAQKELKLLQLFEEVETLKKQQRYAEAADVLREILAIDPDNAKADNALTWAEDFASYKLQNDAQYSRDTNRVRALTNAREALDPIDNPVSYPGDWVELSKRRGFDAPPDEQSMRVELDKSLDQLVDSLRIPESSFELVLEFLKENFQLNISADWKALEEQTDVTRDTIIDEIEVRGTNLRTLIQIIIDRASPIDRLGLDFRPGELVIVPFDSLTVYPRMYDVLPYIYVARPQIENNQQTGGTGGGGGGSDIFGDEEDEDQEELIEDLQLFEELFRTIIGPDNFPVDAQILAVPESYLLVTQTYENHKKIEHFLRTSEGPFAGPGGSGKWQAAFEARFLTVTNNFLEEIGIDLDFVFNSGTAGFDPTGAVDPFTGNRVLMPRASSRAGFIPSVPPLGTAVPQAIPTQPYTNAAFVPAPGGVGPQINSLTPVGVASNSVDLTNPINLATGVSGSFSDIAAPALNVAGSFLDNLQVDFLIRATQADRRSSIVSAPRVTVTNGQDGAILFGRTQNYVSNLSATPDTNVVNTETEQIDSGTSLILSNVVISPNRKYVTTFISLAQNGDPVLNAFDVANGIQRQTIILPDQEVNQIITQASIPDGGTILLGGIKRVAEIEIDAGVPILSKIPIVKRAFTNTSTIKDTQTLLVLIKTNIIIPQEAEQEAFPTLAGTP